MNIVRDCMFPDVSTLSPTATLLEAVRRVLRGGLGFSVVLDNMNLVGLVTEYDFIRWMVNGYDLSKTKIGDLHVSVPQTVHENTPCQSLFNIYTQRRFRRFPVLNDDELLSGGISEKQILRSLPRSKLMAHYLVSDVVVSAPPILDSNQTVMAVARKMVADHRGCVLIQEGETFLGMITEGDLLRFRVDTAWNPEALVKQLPLVKSKTIEPDRNLLFALDFFAKNGHRRVPVVTKEGQLTGLLTQTDILKQVADSARLHKAVLNPEDIHVPALWFEPDGEHRILALNNKGIEAFELKENDWVGRSVHALSVDPNIWNAISVLLQSCGTINSISLPLRTGEGGSICVSCRFSLVHTPTGEDRIFLTINEMEDGRKICH